MKPEEGLCNSVRATRTRFGLSQQQLADAAGIARQTVGGIEGGLYAASASVALKLARALDCSVEELFWLEDQRATVEARLGGAPSTGCMPCRAVVARVRGRWVAQPLYRESAFRSELIPSDGTMEVLEGGRCEVRLIDDPDSVARTVLIAGCAPALSLWARSAERWHPGLRAHWLHANSTDAVTMLRNGEVHAAGLHIHGKDSEGNLASVRAALSGESVSLVNVGVWREGLLLASGNPRRIESVADLRRQDIRIMNREKGAGSRILLEDTLAAAGISPESISGWDNAAGAHEAVARAVASGDADAGMSTEAMADLFGLDFLPIQAVRYDMAVLAQDLAEPHIRGFFATLDHRWVRAQLRLLGGFDTTHTGEITPV